MSTESCPRVLALSGGVGGAKLAHGLYSILPDWQLQIVVNTGDDFEHLGLHISPDIDTLLYTLSGLANPATGWGRDGEQWLCMEALSQLGEADWFQLGDRDLAMHLSRSHRLRQGSTLTQITQYQAERLSIQARITPMSDDAVPTRVHTDAGRLDFQHYFVKERCLPQVHALEYTGADAAQPAPAALAALQDETLEAVIICPSNPYLSIAPILALPGFREALRNTRAPVIAVSPLVNRKAVKGPTDKIMRELSIQVSSASIANHYADCLDGLVIDYSEQTLAHTLPLPTLVTNTLMQNNDDRCQLAHACLNFASELKQAKNQN